MLTRLKNAPAFEKTIYILMTIWLAGFFLSPTGKQHYQFFLFSVVLSAFWLIATQKINYKSFFESKVLLVGTLYASFFFISIAWSSDVGFAAKSKEIKTFLYLIFFGIVFLYVLNGQSERLSKIVNILILAAVASLLINFILFYGVNAEPLSARFAGMGRLWNPLWAAAIYGATALIILAILLDKFYQLKPLLRLGLLIAYVMMALAVFLTQSRTPIAAIVLLSFFIMMTSPMPLKIKLGIIVFAIFSGLIAFFYFLPLIENNIARGQSYRLDLWAGFIERAKEHLFFGHGGGSTVPISSPVEKVDGWHHYHSTYIGSLVEMGLVGLFLHLLIIVTTLSAAWKMRDIFIVKVAGIIFLYICILGITFGHGILTRMNTQWLIFWMPVFVIGMYEINRRNVSVRNNPSETEPLSKN